jgi:hypothetical protein
MSRLRSRTVREGAIDPGERARMLALMHLCYEQVDAGRFQADLAAKQFVILLDDRQTGELCGFSTIRLAREATDGREVEVLFSGDTVIHPDYWGEKVLDAAFARFLLARVLAHPLRPLYWLLLSAGYKTYLMIINYFPGAVPRRDRSATAAELGLRDVIARRWFGAEYDAGRGLVRFAAHYRTRAGISPIDRAAAAHPDIAFYAAANPGHVQGDELVCLARVRLRDLARAFARIAWKRGRRFVGASGRRLLGWRRA